MGNIAAMCLLIIALRNTQIHHVVNSADTSPPIAK
jgi:hypothetical protein